MKAFNLLACAAFAAAVASSANAGVIYQSTPSLDGAGDYWCSDCSGAYQALDPFTLAQSASITGVDVTTYATGNFNGLDPFTVEIWDNSFSAMIFSQAVTPTLVRSGTDSSSYDYDVVHASLTGLSLTGGQQYWISFYGVHMAVGARSGNNDGAIQWHPNHTPGSGRALNDNLSYALYAVPEPATWTMLLAGFGGLGALLRRRSRSERLA